ncbi:sulfotransferase family protein [Salinibacter ruber]|uniref:sulfotransferase family protein n=1 Tax=Salinibacter ruber TaxID=146919 RepID=UPI000E5740B2|nr:sulfotransferase [Salinibacter ruber]
MKDRQDVVPIFIFSLPRSGSTLLQRLISSHPQVGTTGEPWIQLLLLGGLRSGEVYADYDHSIAAEAFSNFFRNFPDGKKTYLNAVNHASKKMYKKASDKPFFVDKTPRYSLICDEIINAFPNSKYIFLWRHPLSVVASISNTWGNGSWNPNRYKSDVYRGLKSLVECYSENEKKSFCLKYENLTSQPEKEIEKLLSYVGLEYDSKKIIENFYNEKGWNKKYNEMGDPTLNSENLRKIVKKGEYEWVKEIKNILRKKWAKKYIKWIGKNRMQAMGYKFEKTCSKIEECNIGTSKFFDDLYANYIKDVLSFFLEPSIIRRKLDKLSKGKKVNRYG